MRRPRWHRFTDMVWTDHTRPTEWWNGVGIMLAGVWMYEFYLPPTVETAQALWRYIGPNQQGVLLVVLGLCQSLSALTKWVRLRKWSAIVAAAAVAYAFAVYAMTAFQVWATPMLGWLVVREVWVAWRIIHDKAVNGADRRGGEPGDNALV